MKASAQHTKGPADVPGYCTSIAGGDSVPGPQAVDRQRREHFLSR
jgi:hypothetical protein